MFKRLAAIAFVVKGDLRRLWFALRHPESPRWLRVGTALLLLYLVSPIDLIPDWIPLLGVVDDAVIAAAAIHWMLGRLPPQVRRHVEQRLA